MKKSPPILKKYSLPSTSPCNQHKELVFLHGFLGSPDDGNALLSYFPPSYSCYSFSLPSPVGENPMEGILQTLYEQIQKIKLSKINLIGYSMGGRIALAFAQKFPHLIEHLIILSANPGIESDLSRKIRIEEDLKWVQLLEEKGLDSFLTAWYDQPLFASLRAKKKLFSEVLLRRKKQNISSLKKTLLYLSPAKQPSFWHILKNFPFSTLFLFGEYDMKYRAIAKSISEIGARVTLDLIAKSGHAVHLENPKLTSEKIRRSLVNYSRLKTEA